MDADEPSSLPPEQPRKRSAEWSRQFAMAMELPFVLVAAVVIGGLFGYFLDRWLGTGPFLMLALGAMGFYAGVRDVLRRLSRNGKSDREHSRR